MSSVYRKALRSSESGERSHPVPLTLEMNVNSYNASPKPPPQSTPGKVLSCKMWKHPIWRGSYTSRSRLTAKRPQEGNTRERAKLPSRSEASSEEQEEEEEEEEAERGESTPAESPRRHLSETSASRFGLPVW